eukprot:5402313-Pleurochrysis_carterae.AAC.4
MKERVGVRAGCTAYGRSGECESVFKLIPFLRERVTIQTSLRAKTQDQRATSRERLDSDHDSIESACDRVGEATTESARE